MAFCLVLLTVLEPPPIPWGGSDYLQFHVAWELLLSGKNPYDRELAGQRQMHYGFPEPMKMYAPPWSMLPSLPLVGLSYAQASMVHLVINALLLIFVAICWTRLLFPGQRGYLPMTIITLPLWLPCVSMLGIGQISAWPLVGFTGWLYCTIRQRPVPAGVFLALTIIKPHLGLLPGIFAGVYALRHFQWKTILAFTLTLLAATALMMWLRPTIWSDYLAALQSGVAPTEIRTATFDGWGRYHFGQDVRYLSWGLWGIALLLAALAGWRCPQFSPIKEASMGGSSAQETLMAWSAMICIAAVAFVPYAFSMDFVFMLPGFILAIGTWLRRDRYWQIALLGWLALDLYLVVGVHNSWGEYQYWFIPWIGLIMMIVMLRRRRLDSERIIHSITV